MRADGLVDEQVAIQREGQTEGIHEGDMYDVCDGGKWWAARLVCGELGWYLVTDDRRRTWPLISLWRWQALGHGKHWEGVRSSQGCGSVACVGTAAPGAAKLIEQVMLPDNSVLLIDIRYAARSRWVPQWNKSRLLARWGARYTHERGLSNANYREVGKLVKLVNPEPALAGAVDLLTKGYSLVLMCACDGEQMACHCRLVLSLIEERVRQVSPDTLPLAWVRRLVRRGSRVETAQQASGRQASL
jgi:hypothetical protein